MTAASAGLTLWPDMGRRSLPEQGQRLWPQCGPAPANKPVCRPAGRRTPAIPDLYAGTARYKPLQGTLKPEDEKEAFSAVAGSGYSVVVIDSGVDIDHAAYGPRLIIGHDLPLTVTNIRYSVMADLLPLLSRAGPTEGVFGGGIAPGVIISVQILNNITRLTRN